MKMVSDKINIYYHFWIKNIVIFGLVNWQKKRKFCFRLKSFSVFFSFYLSRAPNYVDYI